MDLPGSTGDEGILARQTATTWGSHCNDVMDGFRDLGQSYFLGVCLRVWESV